MLRKLFSWTPALSLVVATTAMGQSAPTPVATYPNTPYIYQDAPESGARSSTFDRYYSQTAPLEGEPSSRMIRTAKHAEVVAQGSDTPRNTPSSSDWGTSVSVLKQNYGSTATSGSGAVTRGEIDAIEGIIRQDTGDANAFGANVQLVDRNLHGGTTDGFASSFEGVTSTVAPGSATIAQNIDTQLAAINTVTRTGGAPTMYGVHSAKLAGAGGAALDVNAVNGATWQYGLEIYNNGALQLLQSTTDASLYVAGPITAGGQINGPAWTGAHMSVASTAGVLTDASAYGRFGVVGKTATLNVQVHIQTNGSATGAIVVTLPAAAASLPYVYVLAGRENHNTGKMLQATLSGTTLTIFTYDNQYPGGDLADCYVTGSYEVP
ncbi:hypothetical protein [uncultured Sphingomonas sp.]|uniref:hypothetical protein n=1 Tax=uncultured Sphingomonas sp. TaxID=158754 RepID=UPI0035CADFAB